MLKIFFSYLKHVFSLIVEMSKSSFKRLVLVADIVLNAFKNFFKGLPLIAGLVECNFSDYKRASADVVTNFIFTTMPIWLGVYITLALQDTPVTELTFLSALVDNIDDGELFIFATATLGPIVYIAWGDVEGVNRFPTKLSHGLFVIMVVVLSACSFGLERAELKVNENFTFYVSIFLFIFSWFLLSLATVYKRQSFPSSSEALMIPEKEFTEKLSIHRGSA